VLRCVKEAEVIMRDAISVRSRIKLGVVVAVALAIVALMNRGRLTAQGGLAGTWSGPVTIVLCGGDVASCANGMGTASITISDTPTGFTGQTADGNQLDGYYVNQSGTNAVLAVRVIAADGSACPGAIQTGSMVVDLTQNTLTASSSGIEPGCHAQIASFTLMKQ
jgi:hypothetical protein